MPYGSLRHRRGILYRPGICVPPPPPMPPPPPPPPGTCDCELTAIPKPLHPDDIIIDLAACLSGIPAGTALSVSIVISPAITPILIWQPLNCNQHGQWLANGLAASGGVVTAEVYDGYILRCTTQITVPPN